MKIAKLIVAFKVLLIFNFVQAQENLSAKDAGEISYRAELLVNEFRDLLNIISNSQTDIKETKDLIFNSYNNNSKNKIFYDSTVIIENDINPMVRNSESSKDLPIANYLNGLDLFYAKSDTPSVEFEGIKVSNIKKGDYLYVKVYYRSAFKNKNNLSDSLFEENTRVAEIRVEKKGSKWTGAIMNVSFYPGQDIATDTTNDVQLSYAPGDSNQEAQFVSNNEVAADADKSFEETLKEKERQRQIESYREEKKVYDLLIERGDQLIVTADYASAAKIFTEAQELKPYEIYPKIKLAQIRKQAEQSAISATELFGQFISKAQVAENARKYELAKELYMKAFSQKPEEAQKYTEHLRSLNNKIRTLSELGEKFISGLYKEAIKDYDGAIKKDNTNSDYYLGRAKCYDKLNDYSKALKDYTRSIDLDNNNLEALQLRADLYKRNNEYYKALSDYTVYLTVDKSNIGIYTEMSALHVLTNNLKSALDDLDKALLVNPKVADVYFRKGILLLKQQDLDNATVNFTTAIQLDSNYTLNYYYRAESKLLAGKVESAAQDFGTARTKGLDSTRVRNIELYAEEFSRRGQNNFQVNNFDSAIRSISYAILLNPDLALYRFLRGEFQYALQRFDEAIINYDKAIKLDQGYREAFYKRGLCYNKLKKYLIAIENFNSAIKLNAQDIMSLKDLGDSYFQLNDFNNTISCLENCLRVISSNKAKLEQDVLSWIYNTLGKAYIKTKNYEKAISNCKGAVKVDKDFAEAYYNRGYAYYMSGDLGAAAEDLLKALSYKEQLKWNYTLAQVYQGKLEYANAIVYYKNTIKLDTLAEIPEAHYERGYCNYQLQNYVAALPDYLKCIDLQIDSLSPAFNIEAGNIYLNVAKYDSALLLFNKSYSKDTSNNYAIYGIASAYYLQKKTDEALGWFEKLFRLKTFNPSAIKKDKLIASIRDDKRFKTLVKKYY